MRLDLIILLILHASHKVLSIDIDIGVCMYVHTYLLFLYAYWIQWSGSGAEVAHACNVHGAGMDHRVSEVSIGCICIIYALR